MLYSYFFNMLKVGVPGATQVPQLLVYNPFYFTNNVGKHLKQESASVKTEDKEKTAPCSERDHL